jgi:1-acyl-sn-glycerol-3-phosphate acyltransferase
MAATLRRLSRLIGFFGITGAGFVEYAITVAWRRNDVARARQQTRWLHRQCQRLAQLLHLRLRVYGHSDTAPLIVCNHVSYLDIIALGAVAPVRFVAKSEVRAWPWFGWLARCAGTIFLNRERRRVLLLTSHRLRMAVQQATRVVIFPEGTSTDGRTVLPFRSSLLAVAVEESWPVVPAWIGYELPTGDAAREVCWWGDMTLLPHLWRLLGHEEIVATVRFGRAIRHWERKTLAAELHFAVSDLATPIRPAPARNEPQLVSVQPFEEKLPMVSNDATRL